MKKLFLLLMTVILTSASAMAQAGYIKGTVVSASDNEPLIGASVVAENGQGAATNLEGQFALRVAPGTILKVSYVGYNVQSVPAADGMVIRLQAADNALDEVVVTGYGSGKKLGAVVGSVSVVHADVIENTPASSFIDALQGQVSGLAINSGSGDPTATSYMALRGQSSLSAAPTPLFICDGAPVSQSFFTSMNPADIESISVLKDGASISIYGSRGANGIIVITTKKGKYGSNARATFRANYGWSQMVEDNVEMMNSKQYMEFRELLGAPLSAGVKNLINNYGISTTWRDEMFRNSAPTYSVEGSVTGGTDNLSYYISLGHYSQDGIIENSMMKRTTLSWSIDSKINDWFRVGFVGNAGFRKSKYNLEDRSSDLYLENPMLLSRMALPYDSPYNYKIDDNGNIQFGSKTEKLPYSNITVPWYMYSYDHMDQNRLSGNLRLYEQITPIKGLIIKAQQAMEGSDSRYSRVIDPTTTFRTDMGVLVGSGTVGQLNEGSNREEFERYYQFTYTNTAEYHFTVNDKHDMTFLVGQESIISRSNGFGVSTSGTTDVRMSMLNQGTTVTMGGVARSMAEVINNSYFVNGNYSYDDRYFFDFSYRRDGSSMLAPGNRWANFGAAGVMWNLKNDFLKESTIVNDLRLHYSYGSSGNDGIDNFAWSGDIASIANGYAGESATTFSGFQNSKLKWETIWTHDVGINVRLFDRVTLAADWYMRTTKDMIYSIPFSLTTGVSAGAYNVCSMENKGIDFDMNIDFYKDKDWYVGGRFQFGYNRNRITELWDGNDEYVLANTGLIMEKGGVFGQYYMVRYVGVDPADGKQVWLDENDNPTKKFPENAYVKTGKSQYAPWNGGFGANARWKGLSVQCNFVWQKGKYMINNDRYFITNPQGFGTSYNQTVEAANFWREPGQVTDIPGLGEEYHLGKDTSWLEDASFVRLKNLTVSYDLPGNIVQKCGLKGLQFHFTGRNLWTITNFSGYDPEPQSNMIKFQYPNTRQYEFGVEVSF